MHYTRQMKINHSGILSHRRHNMTIEDLEQLKADGMIDDRKYQQLKAKISMQGYQPGQQVAPSNAYDMTNYGKNLQSQSEPVEQNFNPSFGYDERNAKIAQLESQIAMVKERIARNERALTGKSYDDVNNKLAALEMRKINSSDPTTLWRWQQQRQDTKDANADTKTKAAEQFANTVDMWVNTRPAPTTEGIAQQISNINSAIRDGKNAGADVSRLVTKKQELEALIYGGDNIGSSTNYGAGTDKEQLSGLLKTTLTNAKNSLELITFKNQHPELTPEQLSSVDTKIAELQKKEKANSESEKFEKWLKGRGYKNGSKGLSPRILATLKRQYGGK